MRIGIDARLWRETGVGRYIQHLVLNLQAIDNKNIYVLFVLEKDRGNVQSKVTKPNWTIVTTNIHWHSLQEQLYFPAIINKQQLDLMHFTYFSFPVLYNQPFVLTIHDLIPWHFPTGKATTLPLGLYWIKLFGYKVILKIGAKRAQKIIAVSEATKKEVIDHLGLKDNKIIVTHEGVDKQTISKLTSHPLPPTPYLLYVGNAYPHKNLERLLHAFASLKETEMKLVLVGKENFFYQRVQKFVKKNTIDNVVFAGYVPDEQLVLLYQHAVATVIPSLMEGFGLPALEAMEYGCPVVCSDIPTLKEVAQDAAVYFDPENISDIVGTLEKIVDDAGLRKKIVQNGKKVVQRFSWKRMAEKTRDIYESCTSLRSGQ